MPRSRRPEGEGWLIQIAFYGYVVASRVALALPERIAYGLFHAIGGIAARVSKKKEVVARNLSRITGEAADSERVESLVVEAYKSYARYWLETFRYVREGKEFFLERFIVPRAHKIDEVRERGKGAIVVVSHLGNWDAAGAWAGASGRSVVTVAEVLRPRRLFDFFVQHRAKLGITIHPAERGVSLKLIEAVEAGQVVAILGDRDLKGTGPRVKFFGRDATLPAGPASIALRTGVPLLFAGIHSTRLPGGRWGWQADMSDPIELPKAAGREALAELTQKVAEHLEAAVAEHPSEWHVFQPFWTEDRKQS